MRRRSVVIGLLLVPEHASTQQLSAKIPRVGIVTQAATDKDHPRIDAFRERGFTISATSKGATSFSNFGSPRVINPVFASWRRNWSLYRSMSSCQRASAPTLWTPRATRRSSPRF